MKKNFYFFVKTIFIITIIVTANFHANMMYSQDWNIYYDSPPNTASCFPGVLKASEKKAVLDYVNQIRSIHGLKQVTYDYNGDAESQAASLMMVANAKLDHQPNSSWQCYTPVGAAGAASSNLHGNMYSTLNYIPQTLESIYDWMIDNNVVSLGHRRAIINPFLKAFSFGRCDGQPKVPSQYTYYTAMSFKWGGYLEQDMSDWTNDFVAVPYQDYPIELFDRSWFLSFSVFYDKVNWGNNVNVNYANATIEMKDDNQQIVQINTKTLDDDQGWGGVMNCLSWKASGLQDRKTYTVTIKNVNVNGTLKNYTYWFNLNNKGMAAPDNPVLFMPPDAATDVSTSPQLQWNPAQRAYTYRVIVSKNSNFTSPSVDDNAVTDYHYSLAGLEPNTKYYWKVSASNEGGESGWSPVWSFTTGGVEPDSPNQLFPEIAQDSLSLTPILIWNKSLYADSYKVQVAIENNFTPTIIDVSGITDTSYTVPAGKLYHDRNYFWRVKAVNVIGESVWSGKRRFRTLDSITSVIEILPGSYSTKLTNYPNPFTGKTNIVFNVQNSGMVVLKVYNSLGTEISTLVNSRLDSGNYMVEFDGNTVSTGTYYYKMFSSEGIETSKMTLVR